MELREAASRQLFDPKTPADRLLEIAKHYPDLIPDVLTHPNAGGIAAEVGSILPQQGFAKSATQEQQEDPPTLRTKRIRRGAVLTAAVLGVVLAGIAVAWFTFGIKVNGAAGPQQAAEKLVKALENADGLGAYGAVAPSEREALKELLTLLQNLQQMDSERPTTSGAIWDGLTVSAADLTFSEVVVDPQIVRVDVTSGRVIINREAAGGGSEAVLEQWPSEPSVSGSQLSDLFVQGWPLYIDAAEARSHFTDAQQNPLPGVPLMAVEEGGRWYISPALTVAEIFWGATVGTWDPDYQYEELPEPIGARTPQQAALDLTAGVVAANNLGRSSDVVAGMPLVERRVLGLYLPHLAGGPLEIRTKIGLDGNFALVSQEEDRALLRPQALQWITSEVGYSVPSIVEVNGLCLQPLTPERSDPLCFDHYFSALMGVETTSDFSRVGLVSVQGPQGWQISVVETVLQSAGELISNLPRPSGES